MASQVENNLLKQKSIVVQYIWIIKKVNSVL